MSETTRDDLFAVIYDYELRTHLGDEAADLVHAIGAKVSELVRAHEQYLSERKGHGRSKGALS
jgi:hypothetical protein